MREPFPVPDVVESNRQAVQSQEGPRKHVFSPVVYWEAGAWHFGVVILWKFDTDGGWMAQVRCQDKDRRGADLRWFDFRGDGAILPLALVDVQGVPVLRPAVANGPDGGRDGAGR